MNAENLPCFTKTNRRTACSFWQLSYLFYTICIPHNKPRSGLKNFLRHAYAPVKNRIQGDYLSCILSLPLSYYICEPKKRQQSCLLHGDLRYFDKLRATCNAGSPIFKRFRSRVFPIFHCMFAQYSELPEPPCYFHTPGVLGNNAHRSQSRKVPR